MCGKVFSHTPYIGGKNEFSNLILNNISQNNMHFPVRFKNTPSNEDDIIDTVRSIIEESPATIRDKVSAIEVRYNQSQNKAVIYFM